jgi:hypothetical protein
VIKQAGDCTICQIIEAAAAKAFSDAEKKNHRRRCQSSETLLKKAAGALPDVTIKKPLAG